MRTRLLMLISSCAVVAVFPSCASPPGSGGSEPGPSVSVGATASALSPGKDFVARNQDADAKLHLLARQFLNNETEVLSLYEPSPGQIIAVGAGRPNGAMQLHPSPDVVALWDGLGAGESMPRALLDAIARQQAGVGIEQFRSNPRDAPESVASFGGAATAPVTNTATRATSSAAATPTAPNGVEKTQAALVGTGYCDAQWPSDFPTNMTGSKTSYCAVFNPVHFISADWAAEIGASATPYNSGAGCTCSCRTVQGFQHIHSANSDGSNATNEWENFVSACPVQRNASVTVRASNWNQTWTVAEDNFLWLQDVGTVSCVFTACASTNDIGSFDVSVSSQTSSGDGLINYIAEAYGP
jgi:hypothetical protein